MAEPRSVPVPAYDAVVLAGGAARRMGGVDKPGLLVGAVSLLDRVLAAVDDAAATIVVGPPRPALRPVCWAREFPPGGGPAAALAAGLALVRAPAVAVLAADLPFLSPAVLADLRQAAVGADGALLVDDAGRDQPLCGVWSTARLRAAIAVVGEPAGLPLRRLLAALTPRRLPVAVPPGLPPPWLDCDDAADLNRARGWS